VGSDTAGILMRFPLEIPNIGEGCVTMIVDNIMPGGSANG